MERSQGSMHEHNDITADLNVNVNAFERRRWHGVEQLIHSQLHL